MIKAMIKNTDQVIVKVIEDKYSLKVKNKKIKAKAKVKENLILIISNN
jgi:hypothetical protein